MKSTGNGFADPVNTDISYVDDYRGFDGIKAADVNGDGREDLIIGERYADGDVLSIQRARA